MAACSLDNFIQGSSSSSGATSASSTSVDSDDFDDSASLFGLGKRDLMKPEEGFKVDDLPSKHVGYVISHVSEMLAATDVYECGGELVAWTAIIRILAELRVVVRRYPI